MACHRQVGRCPAEAGGGDPQGSLRRGPLAESTAREARPAPGVRGPLTPHQPKPLEPGRQRTFCIMGQQVDPAGEPKLGRRRQRSPVSRARPEAW